MSKGSTAKKIKDITRYAGEVGLFELSKQIKKGSLSTKYVVAARFKPTSGAINTTIWFSNDKGTVEFIEPIAQYNSKDMTDAFNQLGYNLV